MLIGVLSIQGGVIEHLNHIKALGHETIEVKTLKDIENINGLILPGGESTAIGKILNKMDMMIPLREKILSGLPVWGTCAGMILLAKEIENDSVTHLGAMDIKVKRNAYGAQVDSFQTSSIIYEVSENPIPLVFIRAPYIVEVADEVQIILKLNSKIVAAKQNNILVTSFHPELTDNLDFHRYFIEMCSNS